MKGKTMRMYIPGRSNYFTPDRTKTFSFQVVETSPNSNRIFSRCLSCSSESCPQFEKCSLAGEGVGFLPDERRLATMFPGCKQVAAIEEEAGAAMRGISSIINESYIPSFTIDKRAGNMTAIQYDIPHSKSVSVWPKYACDECKAKYEGSINQQDDPRWKALVEVIKANTLSKN